MKKKSDSTLKHTLGEAARKARLSELERLTGCPVAMVIEGRCQEPGCQNQYIQLDERTALSPEMCQRLKELVSSECVLLDDEMFQHLVDPKQTPQHQNPPKPVIDTRLRQRCVL